MRSQLRTLSKTAADGVARHLVAAGRLVDEDPQAALQHARAARALGSRVAVVREAVGETAYAAGEWAEAIAELRTARRMTGDDSALPMIADSERALGRADRALRIAQSDEALALAPADRAEMRIVEAGARRDLGQLDAALVTLQGTGLDRQAAEPWSARIWYAYADLLLEAGREDEAREWFVAAAGADEEGSTDADERLLALDGVEILDDDEDDDDAEPQSDGDLDDSDEDDDAEPQSDGDLDDSDEDDDAEPDEPESEADLDDSAASTPDEATAAPADGSELDDESEPLAGEALDVQAGPDDEAELDDLGTPSDQAEPDDKAEPDDEPQADALGTPSDQAEPDDKVRVDDEPEADAAGTPSDQAEPDDKAELDDEPEADASGTPSDQEEPDDEAEMDGGGSPITLTFSDRGGE